MCLPFLVAFSTMPRCLLAGYPDQPLLLPPSFLRHPPVHCGKAWYVREARGDDAAAVANQSTAGELLRCKFILKKLTLLRFVDTKLYFMKGSILLNRTLSIINLLLW